MDQRGQLDLLEAARGTRDEGRLRQMWRDYTSKPGLKLPDNREVFIAPFVRARRAAASASSLSPPPTASSGGKKTRGKGLAGGSILPWLDRDRGGALWNPPVDYKKGMLTPAQEAELERQRKAFAALPVAAKRRGGGLFTKEMLGEVKDRKSAQRVGKKLGTHLQRQGVREMTPEIAQLIHARLPEHIRGSGFGDWFFKGLSLPFQAVKKLTDIVPIPGLKQIGDAFGSAVPNLIGSLGVEPINF